MGVTAEYIRDDGTIVSNDHTPSPVAAFDINRTRANQNLSIAWDRSPDDEAEILKLSEKTRWTPSIVSTSRKEAREEGYRKDLQTIDEGLLLGFIGKSSDNAALAKDDIPQLRMVEGYLDNTYSFKLAEDIKKAYRAGDINLQLAPLYQRKFIDQEEYPELDAEIEALEATLGERPIRQDFFGEVATITAEQVPLIETATKAGVKKAVGALPVIAPAAAIAGLATGGTGAIPFAIGSLKATFALGVAEEIASLEAPFAAKEYSEFRDEDGQPLDPDVLRYAALLTGYLNAGIELISDVAVIGILKKTPGFNKILSIGSRASVKQALRNKPFRDSLKRIAKSVAGTSLINGLEEAAQELVKIIVGEAAKDVSEGEFKDISTSDAMKQVIESGRTGTLGGLGFGLGTGSISLGVSTIRSGVLQDMAQNVKERPQEYYDEQVGLAERLDETKMKTRSPEKTKEFLEENPQMRESVPVDGEEAKVFYQSGDNSEIFTKLGITEEEVVEAALSGQSLSVKLSEIHSQLTLEEEKKFFTIVRETAESLSLAESKKINTAEELKRIQESLEEVNREQNEFLAEKRRVEAEILDVSKIRKLKQPEAYAKGIAELLGNFSLRMSTEADQTPAQTLKRIRTEVSTFKDLADAEEFLKTNGFENKIPLGVTQIMPEGFIMKLFEGANHSTLLHETGHVFLAEVESIITLDKASEALQADFNAVKEWMGVDSAEGITVQQQDKFARAFELYLREGKAPTKELRPFFERFKKWLTTVYQKVKGSSIDVELTDEVRAVFDRLINVEAQTNQFIQENEMIVPEGAFNALGVDAETQLDFRRRLAGATATANEKIQQKLAQEYKKNIKAWEKEAQIEVAGRRVNNLYEDLTSSKRGFNLAASSEFLTAKELSDISERFPDAFTDEGLDPNIVAERFGYANAMEMFQALASTPSLAAQIDRIRENKSLKIAAEKRDRQQSIESINEREREALANAPKNEHTEIRKEFNSQKQEVRLISDQAISGIKSDSIAQQSEVRNSQVNQVREFMAKAILGLNQEEIEFQVGRQAAIRLKAKNEKLVRPDGQNPSNVALEYGYESVSAMLKDLEQRNSWREQEQELVQQKVDAHYLNFTSKDFFLNEANKGLEQSLEMFGEILRKTTGLEVKIPAKEYKTQVEKYFASLPVREATRTDWHLSAMRNSLRNRDRAIKKGEFKEAVKFQVQARLNYEFARKSNQIRRDQTALLELVRNSGKNKGKIEFDYWKNIMSLGNKFSLRKGVEPQKVLPFQNLLDAQVSLLDSGVKFRPWIQNDPPINFRDLSVNQFEELKILFDVLNGVGRKIVADDTILSDQKYTEFKTQLIQQLDSLKPRDERSLKERDARKSLNKFTNWGRRMFSNIDSLFFVLEELDGFTQLGPKGKAGIFVNSIYRLLTKADSDQLRIKDEIMMKMKDPIDQLGKSFHANPKIISNIAVPVPEALANRGRNWYFDTIVSIAFNMGNRGNIEAVKEGYGLSESDLVNILEILTDKDWDAIQRIGDILSEYRDPLFKVKKALSGFMPSIVEPDVFETSSGKRLKGWYYPLRRDLSLINANLLANLNQNYRSTETAAVADGATQERTSFGGNPVKLDLSVLSQHVDFLALYISHAEVIKEVSKIFSDKQITELIVKKVGQPSLDTIHNSIKNIARANYEQLNDFDLFFEKVRGYATVYMLGANLKTALKQFYSLPLFWKEYGFKTYWSGIEKLFQALSNGGLNQLKEEVYRLSFYMKNRGSNIETNIAEMTQKSFFEKPIPGTFGKLTKSQINDALFIFIKLADYATVYPAWLGAFEEGKRRYNGNIEQAASFAGESIRTTQPSFRPIDLSELQNSRKGVARALTMFSTVTLLMGRMQRTDYAAWRRGAISNSHFMRSVVLGALTPPLAMTYTFALLRGEFPEIEELLADLFSYNLGTMPVIKDLAYSTANKIKGNLWRQSISTPLFKPVDLGAMVIETMIKLVKDLDDDDKWVNALWAIADLASFGAKIPASVFVKKAKKGWEQYQRGEGTIFNILIPQTPTK